MKSHASNKTIRVAAIQYQAIPFDKRRNLNELEKLITQAAQAGAQLVVLPEMCTTGLLIGDSNNASSLAETIPGPTTRTSILCIMRPTLERSHPAAIVGKMPTTI